MSAIKLGVSVQHALSFRYPDGTEEPVQTDHNMITDFGMDRLAARHESEVFQVLSYGSGTTPTNKRTADNSTTVENGVVVSETGIFSAADVGRLAVFSNGEHARIVSVATANMFTVNKPVNLEDGHVAVYSTEQLTLFNRLGVTNTFDVQAGSNGVTVVENADYLAIGRYRTFIMSLPGGTTISEFGLSESGITSLFARWVPLQPIVVPQGAMLVDHVTVTTVIFRGVTHSEATEGNLQGFATACDSLVPPLALDQTRVSWIAASGATVMPDPALFAWAYSPCSPYARNVAAEGVNQRIVLSPHVDHEIDALGTLTVDEEVYAQEIREGAYAVGSNRRTLQTTTPGILLSGSLRSIALVGADNTPSLRALFDADVTIPEDRVIRTVFVKSWNRTRGMDWAEVQVGTTTEEPTTEDPTTTTCTTPEPSVQLSIGSRSGPQMNASAVTYTAVCTTPAQIYTPYASTWGNTGFVNDRFCFFSGYEGVNLFLLDIVSGTIADSSSTGTSMFAGSIDVRREDNVTFVTGCSTGTSFLYLHLVDPSTGIRTQIGAGKSIAGHAWGGVNVKCIPGTSRILVTYPWPSAGNIGSVWNAPLGLTSTSEVVKLFDVPNHTASSQAYGLHTFDLVTNAVYMVILVRSSTQVIILRFDPLTDTFIGRTQISATGARELAVINDVLHVVQTSTAQVDRYTFDGGSFVYNGTFPIYPTFTPAGAAHVAALNTGNLFVSYGSSVLRIIRAEDNWYTAENQPSLPGDPSLLVQSNDLYRTSDTTALLATVRGTDKTMRMYGLQWTNLNPLVFANHVGKGACVDLGVINVTDFTVELFVQVQVQKNFANILWFEYVDAVSYDGRLLQLTGLDQFSFVVGNAIALGVTRRKLTLTRTGAVVKLFVDGVFSATKTAPPVSNKHWFLGTNPGAPNDNPAFIGRIDSVAVYSAAKSDATVLSEAKRVPTTSDTNIIRLFKGDRGGTSLTESVSSLHGTLINHAHTCTAYTGSVAPSITTRVVASFAEGSTWRGLTVKSGVVYVTSGWGHVRAYSTAGTYLGQMAALGSLQNIHCIAHDETYFYLGLSTGEVLRYTTSWVFVATLLTLPTVPTGMSMHAGTLYVCSVTGGFYTVDPSNGTYATHHIGSGVALTGIHVFPSNIVMSLNGSLSAGALLDPTSIIWTQTIAAGVVSGDMGYDPDSRSFYYLNTSGIITAAKAGW